LSGEYVNKKFFYILSAGILLIVCNCVSKNNENGLFIYDAKRGAITGLTEEAKRLKNLSIPKHIGWGTVKTVNIGILKECAHLTSVTIPSSVNKLSYLVFVDCHDLSEIIVDKANPYYSSVDGVLFDREKTAIICCPVEVAGNYVIPSGITVIGKGAFQGCGKLTGIVIPESVTIIGEYAFNDCVGLSGITIPQSLTKMEDSIFSGCSGLKNMTIPSCVTSIGNDAFSFCKELTSVEIPKSVNKIGDSAFSECTGLSKVDILNGVESIGIDAFDGCSGLTNIVIPGSVKKIGNGAFSECTGLSKADILNGVESIGDRAFSGCMKLTGMTIPSSVTRIGYGVFSDCPSLRSFIVDDENTAYCSSGGVLFSKSKTTLVSYPAASGMYVIPKGVITVCDMAFYDCGKLTAVTLPEGIANIGMSAFSNCTGLTSVVIPSTVNDIGYGAFSYCAKLKTASVMAVNPPTIGMTEFKYEIKDDIFALCNSLKSITVPLKSLNDYQSDPNWGKYADIIRGS
jgi:hypothetical protein